MSIRRRLSKIEAKIEAVIEASKDQEAEYVWRTDEEWFEFLRPFEVVLDVDVQHEYRQALGDYASAMALNGAGPTPSVPPSDFQPRDGRIERVAEWRHTFRSPELKIALAWLLAILERFENGLPSVTVSEFEELAGWFRANKARLQSIQEAISTSKGLDSSILTYEGRDYRVWQIAFDITPGLGNIDAKSRDAGIVAKTLRELRRVYCD